MYKFTFKSPSGIRFSAIAKDADRARAIAKRNAGKLWMPGTRLIQVDNAL